MFLVEYLSICDSVVQVISSQCKWHTTMGVGLLLFGPVAFIFFAVLSLRWYVRQHRDEVFEHRPLPPAIWSIFRLLWKTKGILPKYVLWKHYLELVQARGDWNDDDPHIFRWSWFISDFAGGAWGFSLWLLFKKIYMTATVNLSDGPVNAALSLGFQMADTLLVVFLRPYNSYQTNLQEVVGSVTNAMAYWAVSLPVLVGPDLLPGWIGDFTTLAISCFATAVAACFAMLDPLATILKLLKRGTVFLLSFLPCLFSVGSGPVAGAIKGSAAIAFQNTQGELKDMFDGALEENFLAEEGEEEQQTQNSAIIGDQDEMNADAKVAVSVAIIAETLAPHTRVNPLQIYHGNPAGRPDLHVENIMSSDSGNEAIVSADLVLAGSSKAQVSIREQTRAVGALLWERTKFEEEEKPFIVQSYARELSVEAMVLLESDFSVMTC